MIIFRSPFRFSRVARVVFCTLAMVSPLTYDLHAWQPSFPGAKVGQMATNAASSPSKSLRDHYIFTVNPQNEKFVASWIEYIPSTCTLISSGSWAVSTPPKYGTTPMRILTGTLLNGDCPGVTFPFTAIYYEWTSSDPTGVTKDSFAATWTSPDFQAQAAVDITLIAPINWKQKGPGVAMPGGVLHFDYAWDSTSGNLADLAQCQVGENVTYPGTANPFGWPSPPYKGSTVTPTILWVPATEGVAQDNHSHATFLRPYRANAFTAHQIYRYKCRSLDTVSFPGWSGITIARTVSDSTRKGCWGYKVMKSGTTASVSPLPGIKPANCASKVNDEVSQSVSALKDSCDGIGLSVALPKASVGLNEPIFLDLTVFNRGAETVGIDLGLNKKANLELTIWEPAGGATHRRLSPEGFGAVGKISLPPGGKREQRLLLNEW